MRKHFRLITLVGIALLIMFTYLNQLNLITRFQIIRLKALECSDSLKPIPSKFWVHATNSIEKYKQLENDFSGFECDLTYIDSLNNFFVFHPSALGEETVLSWKTFSKTVNFITKMLYIDMRGVNKINVEKAFNSFTDSLDTSLLKKNTIIELYDYNAALFFQLKGFNITLSYSSLTDIFDLSKKNILDSIHSIIANIPQLSGDIVRLKEMEEKFPKKKFLVWNLSFKNYLNRKQLRAQLNDTTLSVILVSIRSKYHR